MQADCDLLFYFWQAKVFSEILHYSDAVQHCLCLFDMARQGRSPKRHSVEGRFGTLALSRGLESPLERGWVAATG